MRAPVVAERRLAAPRLPARRDPATPPAPNATLVAREDLTISVARLVVRSDVPVAPFVPGQYFALGLAAEGRLLQRPYSTASLPPATNGLEFLVRLVPGGVFTSRLWKLQRGARLRIGPPKGLFRLVAGDSRTHLFIATGTGISPLMAMAGELRARGDGPRVILAHGVARADELAYRDRLEAWDRDDPSMSYVPSVSRPFDSQNAGWTGLTGRLDAALPDVLALSAIDPSDTVAFLCGNPAMIATVTDRLVAFGVPPAAVVSEQYWTSAPPT